MTNLIIEAGVVNTVFGTIIVKPTVALDTNVLELVEVGSSDIKIFNVNVNNAEFNTFSAIINDELVTFHIDEYDLEVEYQAKTNHFIITFTLNTQLDAGTLDSAKFISFDLSIMGTINSDDKELFINTSIACEIVSYGFENAGDVNA